MNAPYISSSRTLTEKPNLEAFKMHSHDNYELYCFLNGSAKYYIEGNVYKLSSGDILLMKKSESHSLLIDKPIPYDRIVINFNDEAFIGKTAKKISSFLANRPLGKFNKYSFQKHKDQNLVLYLNQLCECEDFEEKRLYLTFILNALCKECPSYSDEVIDNIEEVLEYINENVFKELNLEDISKRFYLSKNYLNRKFKKYTGSTIWNYIMIKRLVHSRNLIKSGEKPTEVYLKCGFNDYGSFYKAYKQKYGISPKEDKVSAAKKAR